ncbi:MAG: OmpH family outer membrane protein [Bacteroidetes bacterium]|nr:OmpH family outer membrane protein [Bacteroidota bacterium]
MKKLALLIVAFFLLASLGYAQKFAYVDSQYILDNIPEFAEAQAQLDELSNQWQKEIDAKFAEVDKMYKEFQAQAVLLPEDMKKKKEQEIIDAEKEAKNLQRTRFGKDGDLFKKRQEFVKPIQEKIYNAIQDISTSNNYAVIFDKGGSLSILFANPKYDISDEVLDKLGASLSGRKGKSGKAADAGGKPSETGGARPADNSGGGGQDLKGGKK